MGGSTTVLTGCPDDECPANLNEDWECEDEDEDGFCAKCCTGTKPDGSMCLEDCDDTDPWTHPDAQDTHVDGLDANCDGVDGPTGDTTTPTTENCSNGVDDDADNFTDCSDPDCYDQCTPDYQRGCNNATVIAEGTYTLDFTNTTTGLTSCGDVERVLRFDPPDNGVLELTLSAAHHVSALDSCSPTTGSCTLATAGEPLEIDVFSGTSEYIVVEPGESPAAFDLDVRFIAHRCGDGILTEYEECDDGNLAIGDGCDNNCRLEPLYDTCMEAPALTLGQTLVDVTAEGTSYTVGTCSPEMETEHIYVFEPPSDGTLSVGLENVGSAVLFVRGLCTAQPYDLGCTVLDGADPGLLHVPAVAGTPLYVFVDGADEGALLTAYFNAY
jgi:cysteine-rich repeat protein